MSEENARVFSLIESNSYNSPFMTISIVKELKIDRSFIAVILASGRSRKDNYFPNGEKLAISKCTFALSPVHH